MRLIMMGTGPFAEPTFRLLHETHHQFAALVTSPIRPRHGKAKSVAVVNGMRDLAHQFGIEIIDPENINLPESQERLKSYEADLMIVCDYGQILAAETLGTARLGGINLHGSLLPKYRGAAPINWAIYHGEVESGVTVIHMTPRVDAGPCIGQATTPIEPEENAVELETRLREIGGWLIRRTVDLLEADQSELLPQDASLASKAPRLKKSDGVIDWSRMSQQIKNHIRAMDPWPKCFTFWHHSGQHRPKGQPVRLIVEPLTVVEGFAEAMDAAPGKVLEAEGDRLVIKTGDGAVLLGQLQPAGKRVMNIDEFLRGYRVTVGERFGPQ